MISKNQIKFVRSLHQAKFRRTENLFIAEGPKIISELLISKFSVKTIYAYTDWILENKKRLPEKVEIFEVNNKELQRISTLVTPNQVLAIVSKPNFDTPNTSQPEDLTIILDDIKDPGNMGTIIRTADWYGIHHIICSENSVDIFNPKVIQASMGSVSRVSVNYLNLSEFLSQLPNEVNVYGALLEGKDIYKTKLVNKGYLLIGSESHGISEELKNFVTDKITIPPFSHESVGAESLNASVATAIICSEFRRQSKY